MSYPQEITGIDDHAKVVQLLSSRHWELEAAVHDAFNEKEGVPSVFAPDPPTPPPASQPGVRRRHMASSVPGQDAPPSVTSPSNSGRSRNGAIVAQRQNWWEWLVNVAIFPLRFVLNAASDLLQFISKSVHLYCIIFPIPYAVATCNYLLNSALKIFFFSVDLVFGFQPIARNPLADVRQFVQEFESEYGQIHPPFIESTYEQVRKILKIKQLASITGSAPCTCI